MSFRIVFGKIGKELFDAFLWIGGLFVVGFFFLYGNVLPLMIEELRGFVPTTSVVSLPAVTEQSRDSSFASTSSSMMPLSSVDVVTDHFHSPTLHRYLHDRLALYKTPFSMLPPGKYLRIGRLGVQAPVIDVPYASATQMEQGAFHDQLMQGVVRYPFTAEPGMTGSMLVFGHSSVDFWETKNNPYGFIFSHLHELEAGDTIELVWNNQQHLYRVEETVIKNPTEINEVLKEFSSDHYLTLMACYPRFSTAQRILVVAKEITSVAGSDKKIVSSSPQSI